MEMCDRCGRERLNFGRLLAAIDSMELARIQEEARTWRLEKRVQVLAELLVAKVNREAADVPEGDAWKSFLDRGERVIEKAIGQVVWIKGVGPVLQFGTHEEPWPPCPDHALDCAWQQPNQALRAAAACTCGVAAAKAVKEREGGFLVTGEHGQEIGDMLRAKEAKGGSGGTEA